MEKDLFTDKSYKDMMSSVSLQQRVVRRYVADIYVDGQVFDAMDLLETLEAVEGGDAYVTGRLAGILPKYGILKSAGSMSWPADIGPNFHDFFKFLEDEISKMPDSDKLEPR